MQHLILGLAAAAAALALGTARAEMAAYAIDPTHTFATFEIGHFDTTTNRGRFDKKEGSVFLDRSGRRGKVEISFEIASITTGTPPFDKHLQSAELLDAAKYPRAHFVGDELRFEGDRLVAVSGRLTLKGQSHPVTFKANRFNCYNSPMLKREVCGGDFETTIDRTQFGVDYGVQWGFAKNVRIVAQIEAIRQ